MRSGLVSVILVLLFVVAPFGQMRSEELEPLENKEFVATTPFDILMYGNSYTSANNLASLVQDGLVSGGVATNVDSLTGGGMTLDGHSQNAQSSGHSWNTTLNDGTAWDYVILQDQSQIPGFYRNTAYWLDSLAGAQVLDGFAEDVGAESILMMTWGRRDGDSSNQAIYPDYLSMQERLEDGYIDYRDNMSTPNRDVWIAPVGLAFKHIYENVQASGKTPEDSGNLFYDLYTGDGSHPSLSGSYLASCVLYATITGNSPVGLTDSTSLSASIKLDLQEAAAATVFNETSHLDYPWQTNTGGGGNGPSITIPASQTLAFDSAFAFGSSRGYEGVSDMISHNGFTYISGAYSGDINIGLGCSASSTNLQSGHGEEPLTNGLPFVAKFDSNGTCIWIAPVTLNVGTGANVVSTPTDGTHKLSIDSNGNLYFISGTYNSPNGARILHFGNLTKQTVPLFDVYLAKINQNGSWEWVENMGSNIQYACPCTVNVDSSDNIWATALDVGNTWFSVLKKYDANGQLLNSTQINGGNVKIHATTLDSNNNLYFAGEFDGTFSVTINGLSQSLTYESPGEDLLVGKMDTHGNFLWVQKAEQSSQISKIYDIVINGTDEIYLTGHFYATLELANTTLNAGGNRNGFLAKINSTGDWQWLKEMDCSCTVEMRSITADVSGNLYVGGYQTNGLVTYGNGVSNTASSGGKDAILAKYDGNGIAQWAKSFGSNNDDQARAITSDRQGNLFVTGIFGETVNIGEFQLSTSGYADIFISRLSVDYDDDQIPDVNDVDDDGDFIHDPLDSCHYSPVGFRSTGSSDHDSDGCQDDSEDDDDDNDQLNDTLDSCPKGMTGWIRTNASDLDNDGCMDAIEDYDDDNDGVDDYEDYCSRITGNSTFEFEKGCPDRDGDGRPDIRDPFPNDDTEWSDLDSDGTGDNSDEYPLDSTQNSDFDRDGFGDEEFGNNGDSCPLISGTSTIDRRGCIDSDGDGWSDEGDDFPDNPNEYLDTDGDTVPNHLDEFPYDPTQKQDTDGDGYGDNADGNLGDAYPNDPTRHADSDRDTYDDDNDAFPFDSTQWSDSDGDGYGDNRLGLRPDAFPLEPSQWSDVDGDGWGDNETGYRADAYPTDITQWSDMDGDGYGDNQFGINPDAYPKDPTQWADLDQDGLGDNPNGTNPDPFVNDTDNDGYNNSIDPLPTIATPGDLDGDMCLDEMDLFPSNPNECKDSDGDGWGDNQDSDDDNDGINDITEVQEGTDPMDASSVPVESFEVRVPGTVIGLGAWDLMGIFGGVPFFSWLAFCLVTRGGRSRRYERSLFESKSEEELSEISRKYEMALMLRLLGPHQALRLERVRSNLEVHFNEIERKILEDPDFNLPNEGDVMSPSMDEQGVINTDGYEWIKHEGLNWYRVPNIGSDWSRWQ